MNEELLTRVIDGALAKGAADAEAVATWGSEFDVDVANGEVETLALAESGGIGLRVFTSDRRLGFAYSTRGEEGIDALIASAWDNACANDPDPANLLPGEAGESDDDWSEQDFRGVPVADKVALAKGLEQAALAADSRMKSVQEAAYGDIDYQVVIANSKGLTRRFRNSFCICSVTGVAESHGDQEMAGEFDFARSFESLRWEWVAGRCASRAAQRLGGKPCASKTAPVVLDNQTAASFLRVLGNTLNANSVLKGKSLFAGRLGETVASGVVSLVDQNDYAQGMYRAPFDGEGVSAQATPLIENGVLRNYMHNVYSAARMDARSTANAGRGGGYRSTPEISATSCFMAPGEHAPEALWEGIEDGFYVTDVMGVHTANPISGDFSIGASGLAIANGKLGGPIRGVTVAGNLTEFLRNIDAVGNDLRFLGTYGAPSARVSQMVISGT